jgi:hypothetical protein
MTFSQDYWPSAAEPLLIMAMDHRESFGRSLSGVRDASTARPAAQEHQPSGHPITHESTRGHVRPEHARRSGVQRSLVS